MSTYQKGLTGRGPDTRGLSPTHLVAIAAGVIAGLLVWRIGLPDVHLWDTTLEALTVPTALTVGAGVGVVVIAVTSHRAWRVSSATPSSATGASAGPARCCRRSWPAPWPRCWT